jgi:hypothetical protein
LRWVFNPYADRCPKHDSHDAARIRRRNLVRYLDGALDTHVETMWIARDLGYRSGRRTGIPITDELRLERAAAMMGGVQLDRATLGPPVGPSALQPMCGTCWVASLIRFCCGTLSRCTRTSRTIRSPIGPTLERSGRATWLLTVALIGMVRPKRVVTIGREAADALAGRDMPVHAVRHPSQGGQSEFITGISDL